MAEELEQTKIEDVAAPALEEPRMDRGPLRPPDWRYREAQAYLVEQRGGATPPPPCDALVQYVIRGLRAYGGDFGAMSGARRYMLDGMEDLHAAMYFGLTARNSAMSAAMDACLIKGLRYGDSVKKACGVTRQTYDLYAGVFFDLSGIRAVHAWMQDFLFAPERYGRNTALLRARLLAYYGDTDAGLGVTVTGMLKDSESGVMKALTVNERQKKIFDYVAREVGMEPETYVAVMEAAARSMTDHDFQEKMHESASSGSLESLAVRLEEGIRAFSGSDTHGGDTYGLDFTNRYTKALMGKEDGKQNIGG